MGGLLAQVSAAARIRRRRCGRWVALRLHLIFICAMRRPRMTLPQPDSPLTAAARLPLESLDPQITSIQPGGGWCMRIELAWGFVRRWYLKTFRRSYVARMQA